jgi:hypothetical protein
MVEKSIMVELKTETSTRRINKSMKANRQHKLILMITIFVMTLSLFNTGIVFADDGQPPVEPAATEEPVVIDVQAETPKPAWTTEPTSTEETVEEETSVQEILEQIPDEMAVIVLNEQGHLEPMATEAAAETILTSDPMWCPTNQIPGDPGCTAGYATAAELIAALNGVTGDGTIYFTSTYSTDDLWFDQTNTDLAGLSALTIQGGWNGSTGNAFALSGSTLFDGVGIEINNWNGAITLNNIIVNGAHGNGIVVVTDGDIHLDNVSSSNNDGSFTFFGATGAVLNNSNGSGDVILTGNNTFNNNDGGSGLGIGSTGNIILSNITANNNDGFGTVLNGSNVILTGVNNFSGNGSYGLYINSMGDVILENITANENDNENMNAAGVYISNVDGGGDIILTGTNEFNNLHEGFGHNYGIGLAAYSAGDITLSNIFANDNAQFNILLDNTYGTGNIVLNGTNVFTGSFIGARILSNGSITMENVTASGNMYAGLDLITSSGDIEINCGSITNNENFGIVANSPATATLNGVMFSGNLNPVVLNGGGTLVENPFACGGPSNPKPGTAATGNASDLPVNLINVASGQSVELDCEAYNGTRLSLSNGSSLFLPCPLGGSASLTENSKDDLPGILPEGQVFQSGFTTVLNENGTDLDELGTYATVSFSLPEGVDISTLSILYWNGDQWVEVDVFATDEGHLEAFVKRMGTFVLVSK